MYRITHVIIIIEMDLEKQTNVYAIDVSNEK